MGVVPIYDQARVGGASVRATWQASAYKGGLLAGQYPPCEEAREYIAILTILRQVCPGSQRAPPGRNA